MCRMELYVYRYSKPSRKQEREPLTVPAPSHTVTPLSRLEIVSYSMGGKRCLPEINTMEK
ncbi:hypothetical protein B0T18DRAFT_417891 [Schizothecium vesticola]|uniref:Uncharacterized protein n=1 Tax=Schizothecium vesticola TaxID=314040 RepID=A0AA40EJE5_9PEZI|nr:hypothetical protein B0T18DRAFT_417891 [Schizothecium vesticola]